MIEVKLKDITLNITDGKHGDCESEENSGFYFISCKDIYDGSIHYHGARQITEYAYIDTHKRTMLEPNDILVTNSGTIGRMALVKNVPETFRTTFQKSVAIIKPNQEAVRPVYLYYSLLNCVNQFINQSNGVAQKNLLLRTMREFRLTIAKSVEQQNKISNVLRTYDVLIENNQKQIKLLEEAAQRLYKEWFVDLRFPGYENVKVVDGVPEGWKKVKMSEVATVNKQSIPKQYPYNYVDYIDLGSVSQGRIEETIRFEIQDAPGRAKRIASDGDIIWGMVRPNLKSYALVFHPTETSVFSTGFAVLSAEKVPFSFLYCHVIQEGFVDYLVKCTNGAAYPAVKPVHFKEAEILLPTNDILSQFHLNAEPMYRKIESLENQICQLKEARDRLLPKLMSGEIEV